MVSVETTRTSTMSEKHNTPVANEQSGVTEAPLGMLERVRSLVDENTPAQGTSAVAGCAAFPEREPYVHHYVWKRLAEERELPSQKHDWAMLMTLFVVMILAGWNDGTTGALLPALQDYYHVGYLVISIVWLVNALGFVFAGFTNVWLSDRFGFGIVTPFGAGLQVIAYSLMCWGPPFPLFVISFFLIGWGLGLQDAQVNSLTSRMKNANTKMFLMHAVYGLGATCAPLVATQFVKAMRAKVWLYYCVSLGLAVFTVSALLLVFRLRTDDQIVGRRIPDEFITQPSRTSDEKTLRGDEEAAPQQQKQLHNDSSTKMKRILRTPVVWCLSAYILLYVGIEVTIGGWATSFLIAERGGDDSSGYVSSGFFGGLTLGRVILIPVTALLGRSNSVWVYTILALALEVVVWCVYSVLGNALAFAFIGLLLGPMYPIVMMVTVDVLPGQLQSGAIGFIASMGQVGSAIMPFLAGGIAEKHGPWILQPLMVSMMAASLALWAFVPRRKAGVKRDWPWWKIRRE